MDYEKPLFQAVLKDDIDLFISLLKKGESINSTDESGNTLLHTAIKNNNLNPRAQIFDYVLKSSDAKIDITNIFKRSPLAEVIVSPYDPKTEYFLTQLIKKGADVNLVGSKGDTPLHLICDSLRGKEPTTPKLCQILVENGAHVDAKNDLGQTPILKACKRGNLECVYVLLYHGADPSIACDEGYLPIGVLRDKETELQEILYFYTFGGGSECEKRPLDLCNIIKILDSHSELFFRILDEVSEITYTDFSLEGLDWSLSYTNLRHLQVFIERFGDIVKEMLEIGSSLTYMVINKRHKYPSQHLIEFINIIFGSHLVQDFVESVEISDSLIAYLIEGLHQNTSLEEVTKLVCYIVSYGINVTSWDMDTIFKIYGECELFNLLLHMNVQVITYYNDNNRMFVEKDEGLPVTSALMYSVHLDINNIISRGEARGWDDYNMIEFLDFFALPQIKELLLALAQNVHEITNRIEPMPEVPSLIELSRDAARNYIVKFYKIQNCSQFYTVLRLLPIGEMNKDILSFRRKLYGA